GAAGLAVAVRSPGMRMTLVEIDPALCRLAAENARINGMADRVNVLAADVTRPDVFAPDRLTPGGADRVLMNPPFNDPGRHNVSPDAALAARPGGPARRGRSL